MRCRCACVGGDADAVARAAAAQISDCISPTYVDLRNFRSWNSVYESRYRYAVF